MINRIEPDELKDQRVVTMMSSADIARIDDWMFDNRIRSRGEAIRLLIKKGLEAKGLEGKPTS